MKSIAALSRYLALSSRSWSVLVAILCLVASGCGTTAGGKAEALQASTAESTGSAEEFLIVDCLLPGQLRQLGGKFTYLTQRRPIKTAQSDCEIRGGEYVAYDRADYSTALRIWLPLAQTGDATAQTYVGEIYEKGLGLDKDYVLAAHWYGEAAKQGFSRAQINLGNLYEKGLGVPQDKQQALNLYRSASGLSADHLLYASTLSTSHVPRQEYETVRRELVTERQHTEQLQGRLDRVNRALEQQSAKLTGSEQQLRTIQAQLELAIADRERAATGTGSRVLTPGESEQLANVEQMKSYQHDLESQLAQLRRQNSELVSSQQALVEQLSGNERAQNQYQQQIEQLEQQLTHSRSEVSRTEQELAAVNDKLEQQWSELQTINPELVGLQRNLEAKNQALSASQVRLAQLESEHDGLSEQLAATETQLTASRQRETSMQQQMEREQERVMRAEEEVAELKARLAGMASQEQAESSAALLDVQRELELRNKALEEQRRIYAGLTTEKQSLAEQIASSERRRADFEARVSGLQDQLEATNRAYADSRREVATLRAQLDQQQATESSLTPQLLSLQREVDEKNKVLTAERVKLAGLEADNKVKQQQLSETLAELDRISARLESADNSYSQEKASLDTLLKQREKELEGVRHQLLLSQASILMERASGEQALARQVEANERQSSAQQAEIQQLTSQLATQLELVKAQKQQIETLEQEARSYEGELASDITAAAGPEPQLAPEPQYAAMDRDGPSIEIIEPPVVLVRSQAEVNLRTFAGERQVVGKVYAPDGLLSLSVNGAVPQLTENNLFRASVPLTKDPTPVEVVLVDNKGRRAALSFSFVHNERDKAKDATRLPSVEARSGHIGKLSVPMGDYYALVIGNNEYRNFSTLETAVNDARETEQLLREKYGFKTKLLLNADRYAILSALNELRETLQENDNLLIYYAGHGKLDESQELGYWLPVDAEQDNNINWISNKAITDILNVIKAKHILVVADSCYAGTLTQTPIARVQADVPDDIRAEWIKVMTETRARITLTSGGVGPVLDGGGGRHSVFSKAFLQALRSNDEVLEGYTLYTRVLEAMSSQSSPLAQPQVPQYAPIHLAGHESGEFFFNPA